MEKEIERNEDGTLTEDQSEKFMLGIAAVTQKAFKAFAEMEPEELLKAFRAPNDSEVFVAVVNQVFQDTVDADLPSVFNDYMQHISITICEKAFQEVKAKNDDNVAKLLTELVGVSYDDMSPKDVIKKLDEIKIV